MRSETEERIAEKDLRRLSRINLLEIIVEQRRRIEELEKQLSKANRQLDER